MRERHENKPAAENGEGEPKYRNFGEVAAEKNNPEIDKYLAISRETYERHGINFEQIKISEDLTSARMEFAVDENMQGHEGIMFGGLTSYFVDSVGASLAWARINSGFKPFTGNSKIKYKNPCAVGRKYIVEMELVRSKGAVERYKYSVRDEEDGSLCAEGETDFFMKKI